MYDLAFLQNWYLVILGDYPLYFPGRFSMFSESQYEVETCNDRVYYTRPEYIVCTSKQLNTADWDLQKIKFHRQRFYLTTLGRGYVQHSQYYS